MESDILETLSTGILASHTLIMARLQIPGISPRDHDPLPGFFAPDQHDGREAR